MIAVLGGAALAGGAVTRVAGGTLAPTPCAPAATRIHGKPAIAYCGPATVVIQIAGRTYRFRNGLCDLSSEVGGLALSAGTLVQGVSGKAGRAFVGLVIAASPSSSEVFEADAGGRQLLGDSVIER